MSSTGSVAVEAKDCGVALHGGSSKACGEAGWDATPMNHPPWRQDQRGNPTGVTIDAEVPGTTTNDGLRVQAWRIRLGGISLAGEETSTPSQILSQRPQPYDHCRSL